MTPGFKTTPSSASFRLRGFHCDAQQCAFSTGRLVSLDVDPASTRSRLQVGLLVDLRHLAAHPARVTATESGLELRGDEFVELSDFEYRLVEREFVLHHVARLSPVECENVTCS